MPESSGERLFRVLCKQYLAEQPVQEYKFHEKRRWRIDFAWPFPVLCAVEIEGGHWISGRHNHPTTFEGELEKHNAIQEKGWSLLRFTPGMLERDPIGCMQLVASVAGIAFYEP